MHGLFGNEIPLIRKVDSEGERVRRFLYEDVIRLWARVLSLLKNKSQLEELCSIAF